MDTNISLPISLNGKHWRVFVVSLNAFTDEIDTLVHVSEFYVFKGMILERMEGNIFILENDHDGNAYVIMVDNPEYEKACLIIKDYIANVEGTTSEITVVPCKKGEAAEACRAKYREQMGKRRLATMSNTWGDCNGTKRVCEEFLLSEIDKAAELGVDIVQIDDGWQAGETYDESIKDERGHRIFNDEFWKVDKMLFPNGMRYVSDYAAKKGVKIGLWFAPDSHDHFAKMPRDLAVLKNAYENWGVRFFKIDMYWIEDDEDRDRFLEFLDKIYSFGDDVAVQLDVTYVARINYLCGKRYGSLFVENRFTRSRTFYPHRTLRNLWLLSKYIPASRLQLELVNPELYSHKYIEGDDFAPVNYGIDYLFASVMVSNPLFWMEMQFVSNNNSERLKNIVSFWKKYRSILSESDVEPIGECPTGRSFTGFHIRHKDGEYALVFREAVEKTKGAFVLRSEATRAELLKSNSAVKTRIEDGMLRVELADMRSYAFLKLS